MGINEEPKRSEVEKMLDSMTTDILLPLIQMSDKGELPVVHTQWAELTSHVKQQVAAIYFGTHPRLDSRGTGGERVQGNKRSQASVEMIRFDEINEVASRAKALAAATKKYEARRDKMRDASLHHATKHSATLAQEAHHIEVLEADLHAALVGAGWVK
jgi:hypothetical protein